MNDESKFHIITTEQKMLQDIRELLIEQNKLLNKMIKQEPSISLEPIKIESNNKLPCKYCNGSHDNQGQILSCAKKNKKKG